MTDQQIAVLKEQVLRLIDENDHYERALRRIVECRCTFSRDRLQHAQNAVAYCRAEAEAVLKMVTGDEVAVSG